MWLCKKYDRDEGTFCECFQARNQHFAAFAMLNWETNYLAPHWNTDKNCAVSLGQAQESYLYLIKTSPSILEEDWRWYDVGLAGSTSFFIVAFLQNGICLIVCCFITRSFIVAELCLCSPTTQLPKHCLIKCIPLLVPNQCCLLIWSLRWLFESFIVLLLVERWKILEWWAKWGVDMDLSLFLLMLWWFLWLHPRQRHLYDPACWRLP